MVAAEVVKTGLALVRWRNGRSSLLMAFHRFSLLSNLSSFVARCCFSRTPEPEEGSDLDDEDDDDEDDDDNENDDDVE